MGPAARRAAVLLACLLLPAAGDWTTVAKCRVHHACGTKGGTGCGQGRSCLSHITTAAKALREEYGSNNPEAGFSDGQTLCYIAIRAAAQECPACEACDNDLLQMSGVNATALGGWPMPRRGGVSGAATAAALCAAAACALLLAAAVRYAKARRGSVGEGEGELLTED